MTVYDPRGGGNVHIDRALTEISVAVNNNGFIADQIAPTVRVQKQSDKYYIFGREGWVLEPGSDMRAPNSGAYEVPGLAVSLDSYFCQEHALQIGVADEERENADSPLSPDRDGTELITSKLLLGRELIVQGLCLTAANYGSGYSTTLSGTAQWSDYTNSTPTVNIKTGIRKIHAGMFTEPNAAVIPYSVMSILEDHTAFVDRVKYTSAASLTSDIVARLLGVRNVVIPGVGYNSARMGQAESLAYIWGKDVFMYYAPDRPGRKMPAFMYEFVWPLGGQVQAVDRFRDENRISYIIRIRRRYDHKFISLDGSSKAIAGYLIKAAVA
ncbi:MAG: hypothetical protein ABL876_00160 [Chitinophagaceae bacterium]